MFGYHAHKHAYFVYSFILHTDWKRKEIVQARRRQSRAESKGIQRGGSTELLLANSFLISYKGKSGLSIPVVGLIGSLIQLLTIDFLEMLRVQY